MSVSRRAVRLVVWLLTPAVVWATSFLGGWFGASLLGKLVWLLVGGIVGGSLGLLSWIILIRHLQKRWASCEQELETDAP